MVKQNICIGFDGVLNNYKGYDGENLGTPRDGVEEFLEKLNKKYNVIVLTARRYTLVIKWLEIYNLWKYVTDVTSFKPPAVCYVDDRGLQFSGDYAATLKQIKKFKPYWEK